MNQKPPRPVRLTTLASRATEGCQLAKDLGLPPLYGEGDPLVAEARRLAYWINHAGFSLGG